MVMESKFGPMVLNMKANGSKTKQTEGKFWHADGDVYEGEWKDDKANGYGIYVHVNGARYEGNWKNDLQDGWGVESWSDGSKYEGEYKEGMKHGRGKYIWNDGSMYDGYWFENKINGSGIYVWPMAGDTMESGKTTCMEEEYILGKTVESTKESM